MRQAAFALILFLGAFTFQVQPAQAVIPGVVSSVGKAILKYFGKQGGEEAAEYLSRKGGREIMERVTLTATCLLYTSPSPRDKRQSRMPSSA